MKKMGLHEIRREFLNFFAEKGHMVLPSFSLIPKDDKSLLLIGAGMAPLKKYFTGEAKFSNPKVVTCQKCIRTGDIENVGKTDRHATFFEMLGNFSFGDYFKEEAITWAWEFLTVNCEIPKKDLWATVFLEDDEAYNIWRDKISLPEEKNCSLRGKEDNFWELEVGPSGPCSEIFVDRGETYGCGDENCRPGCDCDRFIEVWNLVFTQFDKDEEGNYHRLSHPNIDTGMGLERIATVLQETNNIFEIDAIEEIIQKIEKVAKYKYGSDKNKDESVRVIADHIRAVTFMISDSIIPNNEGRGYVLRRLIRRAARQGRLLGVKTEFLSSISEVVIDSWGKEYTDLFKNREMIKNVIVKEEKKFLETLDQGMEILDNFLKDLKNLSLAVLSGEKAFKLYDTYGFPIDLTEEIASEKGFTIDVEAFQEEMKHQRERARSARDDSDNIGWTHTKNNNILDGFDTVFTGHTETENIGNLLAIFKDNAEIERLKKGQEGIVVLDKTPFYPEGGGQVGDTGAIVGEDFTLRVNDTKKTSDGIIYHIVKVEKGIVTQGKIKAIIDKERRNAIRRNHSVTHLLHKALKEVLGEHVNQAGSEVLDSGLRFDFTHYEGVLADELETIEELVNKKIYDAMSVIVMEYTQEEAKEKGAIGLFEDKYGDLVRVVAMGDYSMELCGGTHVSNTAEIGMFKIMSESGIAAGVRRIEATTGLNVYRYLKSLEAEQRLIMELMKAKKGLIEPKIKQTLARMKDLQQEVEELKREQAKENIADIENSLKQISGFRYITYNIEEIDTENLRSLAEELRDKFSPVVILLSSTQKNGKILFASAVSKEYTEQGVSAGNLLKEVAKLTGGGGGGRPDFATAGGKDISKLEMALNEVPKLLEKLK